MEMEKESYRLDGETVETVYYGGGTPSLLTENELLRLQEAIQQYFKITGNVEFTLEANPDDISETSLIGWRNAGINRLSIGVQSFREADLLWMNRAHSVKEALTAVGKARTIGFHDFSIDLIYGIPSLSNADWLQNISIALDQGVTHLSAYALTVEPKTALEGMIRKHQLPDTDPQQQADQFLILIDAMHKAGWEQYEISNFCLPGHRSRHNSAYWSGARYLGLGPGAHSFSGYSRRWNVANNALYLAGINTGANISEEEVLTAENRFNEYVMTALRRSEGIDLDLLRSNYGDGAAGDLMRQAQKYIGLKQVEEKAGALLLTREGKLFADGIAADLFR